MKILFLILTILLFLCFGVFLSFSSIKVPDGYDKILHCAAYFFATATISGSFYYVFKSKTWFNYFLIAVCILGALVGAIVEKLQEYYFPGRNSDPADWFANIAGIMIGIVIVYLFKVYSDRQDERKKEIDET